MRHRLVEGQQSVAGPLLAQRADALEARSRRRRGGVFVGAARRQQGAGQQGGGDHGPTGPGHRLSGAAVAGRYLRRAGAVCLFAVGDRGGVPLPAPPRPDRLACHPRPSSAGHSQAAPRTPDESPCRLRRPASCSGPRTRAPAAAPPWAAYSSSTFDSAAAEDDDVRVEHVDDAGERAREPVAVARERRLRGRVAGTRPATTPSASSARRRGEAAAGVVERQGRARRDRSRCSGGGRSSRAGPAGPARLARGSSL